MTSNCEVQRRGENVFHVLVGKLVAVPGTEPAVPVNAEVTLTLALKNFVLNKITICDEVLI